MESLLLSDVIGDDLDVIGSGPTAPDASTFAGRRRAFWRSTASPTACPRASASASPRGEPETPKPGDPLFRRVRNTVIGSNRLALDAAARRARELGYRTLVLASEIEGETREIARMHAAIARQIVRAGQPARPPACIITGGETTVTIKGRRPGRAQPGVCARGGHRHRRVCPGTVVFSAGTDGSDGPTDAAGAIADGETLRAGTARRARFLDANDSYHYFEALGDLVKTGPTNTNVMDVRLILVGATSASRSASPLQRSRK